MKPLPLTVRTNAFPPATADVGLMLLMAGAGFTGVMVKLAALEVPPPGGGLKTVTEAEPALATSLAGMEAVSLVSLTKAVARSAPFQRTTDPAMKLAPLTVRLKAGAPACADVGLMAVMFGTGFTGTVMVKLSALEVPPPGAGLKTVTEATPVLAM